MHRFHTPPRPLAARLAARFSAAKISRLALVAGLAVPAATAADADQSDAVAAALAAPRPIAAGDSPWLEELTWMEIRDRIAAGTDTVIIPTGGIEENGPYLATGKHNLILEATCPAIAGALGNALCAPVVKFVPEGRIEPPEGAMRYPGTISLTPATYEALLVDIARSLKQAGFRHIVLIGDSGGNQAGMAAVAESACGSPPRCIRISRCMASGSARVARNSKWCGSLKKPSGWWSARGRN